MMNPVTTAVLAAALIITGKWSRKQTPNIDNAIGIAGIALGLALLEEANEKLAKAFAALILVSLTVVYLPSIVEAAGLSGNAQRSATSSPGSGGSGNRPR